MTTKHWFLPEHVDLVGMLRAQTEITVEGLQDLVDWSAGDESGADRVRECEHRADDAKRVLWRALRDAFSPPIDAEDLFSLSSDLDEVLNEAKNLVREMEAMGMAPDTPMHEMAAHLSQAVGHLADAFAAFTSDGDPTACADEAIKSRRNEERVYRDAISTLLEVDEIHEVIARREAYRRLSRMGDIVHRIADRVWYAVVKEA